MSQARTRAIPYGWRILMIIWGGQLVSILGSGLSGFALGVWIFEQTGSATAFGTLTFFAAVPGILLSPLAGALVDRWDRRWAMILGDSASAVATVVLLWLVWQDGLRMWHLYVLTGFSAIFTALQQPAFTATVPLLVPKEQLGRVAGLTQMAMAAPQILTPFLAGVLMVTIELKGILVIDLVTFFFALFTLLSVRLPRPPRTRHGDEGRGSLFREAVYGWSYIRQRPGLFAMLMLFSVVNLGMGMVQVLFTPLVLNFGGPSELGLVLSVASIGYLGGSALMTAWGGPQRKIWGVFVAGLFQSAALLLAILPPSTWLMIAIASLFMIASPIVNGCSQAIWQAKVAPDVMGRVFAIRRVLAWSSLPVSYLVAGPLADFVFEPLMQPGGALAGTAGWVMGTGPGRGIALLFLVLGVLILAANAAAFCYPRLRRVELELPDAMPDDDLEFDPWDPDGGDVTGTHHDAKLYPA